jgi:hypothetical protein
MGLLLMLSLFWGGSFFFVATNRCHRGQGFLFGRTTSNAKAKPISRRTASPTRRYESRRRADWFLADDDGRPYL